MNPNRNLIDTMKSLTFGVEVETVGATRESLARAVATVFPGSEVVNEGGSYGKWAVRLVDGRKWTVVSDGSLSGSVNGEVVTPICTWADLEDVQAVVRALRSVAHAKVDSSCGVHVHVGTPADRFDSASIVRLAKIVYAQEPLIFAALGVADQRRSHYTKAVDSRFIERLASRPTNRESLATAWYDGVNEASYARTVHYHGSRYHGLNLHSVFYRGTAEFRYFEGTLHAGQIRAYVQLCLALATKALTGKGAGAKKRTYNPATAKYDFRVFLLRLGLIGDEFKTARLHLSANLAGSSSRKHGTATPVPAAVASEPAVDAVSAYLDEVAPVLSTLCRIPGSGE